jgi:hypothetical protein
MRRYVIPNVYWLLSEPAAKLRNICYRYVIECPKCVFVDCSWTLLEPNLYAVGKEIVLPN